MLTPLRIAVVAVVVATLPQSAQGQTQPPFLAQLAAEPDLRSYVAPIDVAATIHKFIFSVPFRRHGTARFESPDSLTISLDSVPSRYTDIFGELGDVRTWPALYDLEPDIGAPNAGGAYVMRGVPRHDSDVDDVLIESTAADSPITATWHLHSGWTISATIETELVEQHLLPKHEAADIAGHGMKIHADLTYGDYTLTDAIPAATATP